MEKIKDDMLRIDNLAKTFLLHNQGAKELPVFQNISFQVKAGECVVSVSYTHLTLPTNREV